MRRGLVLGKFMPLHLGHLSLIDYARARCEHLTVLLCAQDDIEPIPGAQRLKWLEAEMRFRSEVDVVFTDVQLPNTSESSKEVAKLWAEWIKQNLPPMDVFFSSEPYGDYLAEYMGIAHDLVDLERKEIGITGTMIREYPQRYWEYLARSARPDFVGTIAIVGTESTGKSTLSAQLAAHFGTIFVPEQARDIIPASNAVEWEDLFQVAEAQSQAILEARKFAKRLLISDTDTRTTQVYGQFLFGKKPDFSTLSVPEPHFDLTLVLDQDAPYVQDGTRLDLAQRNALHAFYLEEFQPNDQSVYLLSGNWAERFSKAVAIIETFFHLNRP